MVVVDGPAIERRHESSTHHLFETFCICICIHRNSLPSRKFTKVICAVHRIHSPIPMSQLPNGYTQHTTTLHTTHSLKRSSIVRPSQRTDRNTAPFENKRSTTTTTTMKNNDYSQDAPFLPTVDDLPLDIRDLLENYSGVKPEDVIAHIVNVVCTVLCYPGVSLPCFVFLAIFCVQCEKRRHWSSGDRSSNLSNVCVCVKG